MEARDILIKFQNYAVIGVTPDTEKYGYKVFNRLLQMGKTVYGVTPKYSEVKGLKMYKSISDIERPVDVCVFVVNKKFARSYVDQMIGEAIRYAWMQPGTYDDELIDYIASFGLSPIKACVLVESDNILNEQ